MDITTVQRIDKIDSNKLLISVFLFITLLMNTENIWAGEVQVKILSPPRKGETFTIEVIIDTVTDLYGLATDITYETEYLEIVDIDDTAVNGIQPDITEGTFLNSGGTNETFLRSALEDETAGSLVLGLSRSGVVQGVDAATETKILSATFKAKKEGTTKIVFTNSGLRDSQNSDIKDLSWKETTITILKEQESRGGMIDVDGDGLPDSWELNCFGDLRLSNAGTDSDGDGLLDRDEYSNKTDPLALTPAILSITPSSGSNDRTVSITNLTGSNFRKGALLKLTRTGQSDIVAKNVVLANANTVTCTFDLTGALTGKWDVELTIPNSETGILTDGFLVTLAGDDLLAYWRLDEGMGTIAGDSSRYGNNGTIYGDVKWTQGKSGWGIDFDGIDDYIDVGDIDLSGDFTISAWLKLSGSAKNMITGKSSQTYEFYVSPEGHIVFNRNSGTQIRFDADLRLDRWYHVAVTHSHEEGIIMYLDGIIVSTYNDTLPTGEDNAPTKIGATGWTARDFFHGIIDEVRVYNRALTSHEIESLSSLDDN